MICPQCSAASISGETGRCDLCGFAPAGNVLLTEKRVADDVREAVQNALGDAHRITQLLRYGDHSYVYLAEKGGPGRLVALKVLPVDGGVEASLAERFQHLAAAVQQLYHPHILPIYSFGTTDAFLWYTMEQMRGPSLADTLRERGPLPTEVCVDLAVQVASALDYAQHQRVLHGNLKPNNVFFDERRRATVTDFAVLDAFRIPSPGETRRRMRSLEYSAPEQGTSRDLTASGDQYSLAAILYQCLTGFAPFVGDSHEELIQRQSTELPTPIEAVRPDVPIEMSMAISRALSRYPAERFLTVQDFAAAVSGGAAAPPVVPARSSQPYRGPAPLQAPTAPKRRSRPGGWRRAVFAVVAMGAVAAAVVYGRQYLNRNSADTRWAVWEPSPEIRARAVLPPGAETRPEAAAPTIAPLIPRTLPRVAAPPPTPVEPGLLFVNATPWGRLTIDGIAMGDTPKARIALRPGSHRIQVTRDGYMPFDTTLTVGAGQEIRLTSIALRERE